MAKYIKNKNININKSNDILELKCIGKAAWKFLSAIYSSGWNSLIIDKNNNSFRQKFSFKFTPKVNPVNMVKKRIRIQVSLQASKGSHCLSWPKRSKKFQNISKQQAPPSWTTTKVNHILKYQSPETPPKKSSKSRRPSLISRQTKSITFKRSSKTTSNPN